MQVALAVIRNHNLFMQAIAWLQVNVNDTLSFMYIEVHVQQEPVRFASILQPHVHLKVWVEWRRLYMHPTTRDCSTRQGAQERPKVFHPPKFWVWQKRRYWRLPCTANLLNNERDLVCN
jgi:hypothetical protein